MNECLKLGGRNGPANDRVWVESCQPSLLEFFKVLLSTLEKHIRHIKLAV